MANGRFRIMLAHHRGPYKTAFLVAVTMLLALFVFFPPFEFKPYELQAQDSTIVVDVVPIVDIPPPPKEVPHPPVDIDPVDDPDATDEVPENAIDDLLKVPPPPIDSGVRRPYVPFDELPVPKYIVKPQYPAMAREAGFEGTVRLKVLIGLNHKVLDAVVEWSDVTPEMEQAAVEAALQCRYKPAKQQGVEVEVWAAIRIDFRLND
jgi:protein TonB